MKFAADLHIHSKYSRATSPRMNLGSLDQWARVKGIKVMGTGDFTHPQWFGEIKELLDPAERGLFALKKNVCGPSSHEASAGRGTRFLLTAEVSCIYSKGGRVRKVHIVIFAPDIESVEKINRRLAAIGNLLADGRPILGLDFTGAGKDRFRRFAGLPGGSGTRDDAMVRRFRVKIRV